MRGIDTEAAAAAVAETVSRVLLVTLEFDSATSYITTASRNIVWDGATYVGVGQFGSVSAIEESGELASYSLSMELTGIPRDVIAVALTEPYQNRMAQVYECLFDEDEQVIDSPVLMFRGRMDVMAVDLGETASITLSCTNRLADWERPKMTRYSDEDQQRLHPGDYGCQYAVQMETKEINWPNREWFKKHAQ
jgi:hypothetical protein